MTCYRQILYGSVDNLSKHSRVAADISDIQTADMTQTLNQNQTPVKGNYIEFTTADKELVSTIIEARDYFGHPYNQDFQNPTFENEYFAFKVDENPDATGNLYYVQRYETEDGKISGGLNNLTIVFKRSVEDPALVQAANRRYYAVDSGRDRMALNKNQLYELGWYYAKTMSNEDLTKAIASLEPVLTSTSTADAKLLYNTKDNSIQFARGLIAEAGSRGLEIDFSNTKIVYVHAYKYGNNILSEKVEKYLQEKGYKFAYTDCQSLGMKSAQEVYDMEHKPHSLKPTKEEVRKLRLLRQAIELFAQNDTRGTIPSLKGKSEYVFDAQDSNNTDFHALVKDKTYDHYFIYLCCAETDKKGNILNPITKQPTDIDDAELLESVTPSLGVTVTLDDLISEAQQAKN